MIVYIEMIVIYIQYRKTKCGKLSDNKKEDRESMNRFILFDDVYYQTI